MKPRAVLISGGTGFIGMRVISALLARGIDVWVWSRDAARARRKLAPPVRAVGALDEIPADAPIDAIVNFSGAQVIGMPWTQARRRVLIDSRVKTTEALIAWAAGRAAQTDAQASKPPMISASAIGFYGPDGDEWFDESSPPQAGHFQCELCVARERATEPAHASGMRVVNLRIGLVLGDGGILAPLARAARLGGAAVIGDGTQWMSWIHIDDMVRVVERALEDETWNGPVNCVSPNPVRQREFQQALTRALRRPLWLRIPAWPLRLAMGEMSELLLRSQRVAPRNLQSAGFVFEYTALEDALRNLLERPANPATRS